MLRGQLASQYLAIIKLLSLLCIIVLLELCVAERKWQVDMTNDENKIVSQRICLLKPECGPCRAKFKMYYYNMRKHTCRTFHWGGCQGNGNRFASRELCMNRCDTGLYIDDSPRAAKCTLTFSYGDCFSNLERYAYNIFTKQCEKHIWSGCGGNANLFETMGQCIRNCSYTFKGTTDSTTKDPCITDSVSE